MVHLVPRRIRSVTRVRACIVYCGVRCMTTSLPSEHMGDCDSLSRGLTVAQTQDRPSTSPLPLMLHEPGDSGFYEETRN